MLPVLHLSGTDLLNLDATPGAASLLAADAVEPAGRFADLLQMPLTQSVDGGQLPAGGKELPLLPVAVDTSELNLAEFAEGALPIELDAAELTPQPAPLPEQQVRIPAPLSAEELPALDELLASVPVDKTPADVTPPIPPAPTVAPVTTPIAAQSGRNTAELRDARPERTLNSLTMPATANVDLQTAARDAATLARGAGFELPTPGSNGVTVPAAAAAQDAVDALKPVPLTTPAAEAARPIAETLSGLQPTGIESAGRAVAAEVVAAVRPVAEAATTRAPIQLSQPIDLPVQQPGWGEAVSERVLMQANARVQNAEIRLTPAELGPLRIQVEMTDGTTNVSFQAQHALTRDALEQALPRLRELFAESGLSLGDASVSDEGLASEREQRRSNERGTGVTAADAADAEDDAEAAAATATRVENGLVDTFA